MKSSLQQQEDSLSTTVEEKNKIQVKENKHLFNYIGKLAADHDVTVSNTMIKITYKKALKDQNTVDNAVEYNTDSALDNGKTTPIETMNLCDSDISVISKSPLQTQGENIFDSTSKQQSVDTEKKKKYMNGLVSINSEGKSSLGKVQETLSQAESTSTPKKAKTYKQITKSELDKRFLKDNNGLVKPKSSIIQKNSSDSKKVRLSKCSDTKIKKLENRVKKKTGLDKKGKKNYGLKQEMSNMELDDLVSNKKLKIDESKIKESEGSQSVGEIRKIGSKRPVMLVDPDLPAGWTRFVRAKNKGSPNEQYVVYVVNPQGKKFRFKWELRKYLQRTNSSLDVNQFFFGLYERPKPSNASVIVVGEEESKNNEVSGEISPEDLNEIESEPSPESENRLEEKNVKSHETRKSSDRREMLFFDPDLPFGWKRTIHSNSVNGRKQVHIISPDGKIFRRRYRLNEYLMKHQYTHNLDRFYFGLYPKKEGSVFENLWKEAENKAPNSVKMFKPEDSRKVEENEMTFNKTDTSLTNDLKEIRDNSKGDVSNSPLYDDPNLPKGWKRFIKIRSCGESAGRMEVIIISPDGRRHRTRKHLQHYLIQKRLNYKAEDFDFTVFGRSNPKSSPPSTSAQEPEPELKPQTEPEREPELEPEPEREPEPTSNDMTFFGMNKKFRIKPVPELDINSIKEPEITPEGHLINTVNGLMMCGGLSSARNERRQRLPRREHEKQLKSYLSSEKETSFNGANVPTFWVQRLVKCRSDLRVLEPDAVSTIADTTKEFIQNVCLKALNNSKHPEKGLTYEDISELVDSAECLSFLKTLIPKKITFREYKKLNRPKRFKSFT